MSAVHILEMLSMVKCMNASLTHISEVLVSVQCLVVKNVRARHNRIKRIVRIAQRRCLHKLNREIWVEPRSGVFWEKDAPKLDEHQFKESFRITRSSFGKLIGALGCLQRQNTPFRKAIPLAKRLAIALYALGSSAEYRTIAIVFGVGKSTVRQILMEFCETVYAEWSRVYLSEYPLNQDRLDDIVNGFKDLGYPQCIGAIDGTHIEVTPKREDATDYFNYKGWYSIILLAAVDHRYRFTYINVGLPGRNHDSFVYNNSSLKKYAETSQIYKENAKLLGGKMIPVHYIGDSAFKLTNQIMKPYPYGINQPQQEKLYNYNVKKQK